MKGNLNTVERKFSQSLSWAEPRIFNNQFIVKTRISQGAFGIVYQGYDKNTKESVAIKVEKEEQSDLATLKTEIHILEMLKGIKGIPKVYWHGKEYGQNVLVLEYLGRDLGEILKIRKKLSLKTTLMLLNKLVRILQQVHKLGIVHRDLKPENILLSQDENEVYLVDFGVSKAVINHGKHVQFKTGKSFIGTIRYASRASHIGHEIARKDDLESLLYVGIYLLKGKLPWQDPKHAGEKLELVGNIKSAIDLKELCKEFPPELVDCFNHLRVLKFAQQPNYDLILQKLKDGADRMKIEFDDVYDWSHRRTTIRNLSRSDAGSGSGSRSNSQLNSPKNSSQASPKASPRQLMVANKSSFFLMAPQSSKNSGSIISYHSVAMNYIPSLLDKLNSQEIDEGSPQLPQQFSSMEVKISQMDALGNKKCTQEIQIGQVEEDTAGIESMSPINKKYNNLINKQVQRAFGSRQQFSQKPLISKLSFIP